MRLLYAAFDRLPSPKGASRHILALSQALAALGVELLVVCPAGSGPFPDAPGLRFWPVSGLPQNPLAAALAFGQELVAIAQAEGPFEAWQLRDPWSAIPLLEAYGESAPPLLWEANGLPSLEWPQHHPELARRPELLARLRQLERQLMAQADAILGVSPTTLRCLQELGAPPEKLHLAPNGVDAAAFLPHAPRSPWPEVLYVGAMQPWQGLKTLLEAMALLGGPSRLLVAGPPGKWGAGLRRQAMALGLGTRVQFLPAVAPELVPSLLARAHVVAVPLDGSARNVVQGACPLKLLEAWAAGRAVVASRVPPVEALVGDSGAACLVPPDDAPALAAALKRLLADPAEAEALAQAGLKRVQDFRWEAQAKAVLACFEALGVISPA